MPKYFLFLMFFLGMLLPEPQVNAQVYEYTPSAAGCTGVWEDGNCWNVIPLNEPLNCTDNGPWPPFAPTGCNVEVIINDDLVIPADIEFGGTFTSLTVGAGAEVTFSGNLSIEGRKEILFSLEGESFINVAGALTLSQGSSTIQTVLNLGGEFTGMLTVGSIEIENRAVLEVLEGGAITSEGPTEYSGNSSVINVTGFFRTQSLLVTGGRLHQFNTYGNSQVVIDDDIDIRGDTGITIGGTSEVYVGRDVLVDGSATIIADDNSKIFVCGEYIPPSEGGRTQEIDEGKFFPCSVLPVELLDQEVEFHDGLRKARLTWETGKEEDLRHFIIERAVGSSEDFEPLGKVEGTGSTTEKGTYEFWDANLPLFKTRVYYRLVQVDVYGKHNFIGEVLGLAVPGTHSASAAWVFFPNPSLGADAKISVLNQDKYNGEPIDLDIYGPFGLAASLKSSALERLNRELPDKMKTLSTGVYFLHIHWGNQRQVLKILKK
ncbi:T9SS type A sorting domain-containing protein [Cyclobacterium salsum]|uniref:T9SS type A sorting domain-containing protein n=1 Tax=Cyclobacterium salsum TaxID=2666329 RepID=UPI0013919E71|nr:T9SS type A sorting domain-containing protein [Cyclobacterium salsum]